MSVLKSSLAAVLLATASMAAHADCTYPKAPDAAPNGNTATKDEMVAGMRGIKSYNEEMSKYLDCTNNELQQRITEAGTDEAKIKQLKELNEKKMRAAEEELTARTDEFNQQVRIFKAKSAPKS
jgi:Spy/CpxP family protein refolding chaperone